MPVTIVFPEDIEEQLTKEVRRSWPSREGSACRRGLPHRQAKYWASGQILGLSFHDTASWLKDRNVPIRIGPQDLADDLRTLADLRANR